MISPRKAVSTIAPYVAGKRPSDLGNLTLSPLKLASNENPLGPSPRVVMAIRSMAGDVHFYPDRDGRELKGALSEATGVPQECICLGNGSDDLLYLLAVTYFREGARAVLASPPYSIQRIACQLAGLAIDLVPLDVDFCHDVDAMARAVAADTQVVFITNPHNPTGTLVQPNKLRQFADRLPPSVMLVVDEAYRDFVPRANRFDGARESVGRDNLVVIRTFSKIYGLAGLRLGYLVGPARIVEPLERVRPPFNVSALAQLAGVEALKDQDHVARVFGEVERAKAILCEGLTACQVRFIPSYTNFVLAFVGDSLLLSQDLMDRGIIVRPGENLGMAGWVRISVGTVEGMQRFVTELESALAARSRGTVA